ncbi:MAG: phosphodiester glycosidase family protein, partial [Candidatus Roizmanbacteria bacterium]|nr:phosphodiester glycosidase family protein [Candidatus Roizmanbacteria bacterium]
IRMRNTSNDSESKTSLTITPFTIPQAKNRAEIPYGQSTYVLYYSPISNRGIEVIPNFSDKLDAESLSEKNKCRIASNGGFYTTDSTPLGLFKINNTVIGSEKKETNLINGFFYLDDSGNPHIDRAYPNNAPTVIQTGPFFSAGNTVSTTNDKPARRVVIIEAISGEYYIAAVTTKETTTSGPFLSDLPVILFSITEPFEVLRALNLDGGAASFYKDESGFTLSELTHVGSVICVK